MKIVKKKIDPILEALDKAITEVYSDMEGFTSDCEEYDKMSDQLTKLLKLREDSQSRRRISPEVLATIGANLVGILLILNYERLNVVTSKALGFVKQV